MENKNLSGDALVSGFDDLGLSLDMESADRLVRYGALIKKWNSAVRLVGNATPEHLSLHILDSAALLKLSLPEHLWTDVGSGAGFPGLVLACLRPEQRILLIEPRERRYIFLRHVIDALALPSVEAVRGRLEDTELPEEVVVMSKALAPPPKFLRMAQAVGARYACVMTTKDGVPTLESSPWREQARYRFQLGARPTRVNLLYRLEDS